VTRTRYAVTLRATVDTAEGASGLLAALGPAASMLVDNGVTALALTVDEWQDDDEAEPGVLVVPADTQLDPAVAAFLNDAGVEVRYQ
jgi:hypothetical protein